MSCTTSSGDPLYDRLLEAERVAWLQYQSFSSGGTAGIDYAVEGQSVQRGGAVEAAYRRWQAAWDALRKARPSDVSVPVRGI